MLGLNILKEILHELRSIRILLEGGKNIPLPPLEEGEDASSVSFTDDIATFLREKEAERFYELKGRWPLPGESVPGPLSPSGKPWNEEKEVEGGRNWEEMGGEN